MALRRRKKETAVSASLLLASLVSGVPPKRVFADCQIGGQKRITLMHVCSLWVSSSGNAEKMVSKQARVFEFPKVYNGVIHIHSILKAFQWKRNHNLASIIRALTFSQFRADRFVSRIRQCHVSHGRAEGSLLCRHDDDEEEASRSGYLPLLFKETLR